MKPENMKASLVGVWLLAVAALGVFVRPTSIGGWIFLVSLALLPAVLTLRAWNQPKKTMSESIRESIR